MFHSSSERNTAPCKDCNDRTQTCHSTCEAYLEYRSARDKMLEDRERERIGAAVADEANWKFYHRLDKKKRRK